MNLTVQAMGRAMLLQAALLAIGACGGETPIDSDSEKETETSTNTDDTASDDGATACLASISGRIVIQDADPVPVSVFVCIGVCFEPISTDNAGEFQWRLPIDGDVDCVPYNLIDTPIQINFRVTEAKDAFAEYSFITVPTQADISDQGDNDFDLDLGELQLFALPEETVTYTPSDGADVSLFGLSMDLKASALVKYDGDNEVPIDHDQSIHVFKAPLDKWAPPFVDTEISALYFLGPRWARLAGKGVPLVIEAPSDFEDGDTATVYLLGDYLSDWGDETVSDESDFIYVNNEGRCVNDNGASDLIRVDEGVFPNCGQVPVEDGLITTPPIPRLTWVGIGK